jgi:HAD superfamily hydrolase (TIGR01509 family)
VTANAFKAVIFDMDGLLVDSEPLWAICEQDMLDRRGKVWASSIQKSFIGMRMADFLRGMAAGYGLSDPVEVMRDEIETQMCELIPERATPRPGALELIDYLAANGIPCAIASSSSQVIIDKVVESHGWGHIFKTRVTGDIVPNGKPAPDVYLEAARQLGVAPADCLALEDSPNGTRSAVAAGMLTFAVPDLSHSHIDELTAITPHVFESLHEVLAHVRSRTNESV